MAQKSFTVKDPNFIQWQGKSLKVGDTFDADDVDYEIVANVALDRIEAANQPKPTTPSPTPAPPTPSPPTPPPPTPPPTPQTAAEDDEDDEEVAESSGTAKKQGRATGRYERRDQRARK